MTDQQIQDMLVGAFEGGSNYWCAIAGYQFAEGIELKDFRDLRSKQPFGELGKFCNPEEYYHPTQIVPLQEGCALKLLVDDSIETYKPEWELSADEHHTEERWLLNREKLLKGVEVMQKKYPRHFADWLSQNDDATTADVYLQCCLFGEAIFG